MRVRIAYVHIFLYFCIEICTNYANSKCEVQFYPPHANGGLMGVNHNSQRISGAH